MEIVHVPIGSISSPAWNPNEMTEHMRIRLRRSIERFGLVIPLAVRSLGAETYETVGGAHRLDELRELGVDLVPCVLVDADDGEAKLLSQLLNHVAGEDDPGLRAELLRDLMERIPQAELLNYLPDAPKVLSDLSKIGVASLAERLVAWERSKTDRLRHWVAQLSDDQWEVVNAAVRNYWPKDTTSSNPNKRGLALYALCQAAIDQNDTEEK